jgi:hypothetical protein
MNDVDEQGGETAFVMAAGKGHHKCVSILIPHVTKAQLVCLEFIILFSA